MVRSTLKPRSGHFPHPKLGITGQQWAAKHRQRSPASVSYEMGTWIPGLDRTCNCYGLPWEAKHSTCRARPSPEPSVPGTICRQEDQGEGLGILGLHPWRAANLQKPGRRAICPTPPTIPPQLCSNKDLQYQTGKKNCYEKSVR